VFLQPDPDILFLLLIFGNAFFRIWTRGQVPEISASLVLAMTATFAYIVIANILTTLVSIGLAAWLYLRTSPQPRWSWAFVLALAATHPRRPQLQRCWLPLRSTFPGSSN